MLAGGESSVGVRGDERRSERGHPAALAIGAVPTDHSRILAVVVSAVGDSGAPGVGRVAVSAESPQWLASRGKGKAVGNSPRAAPLRELFGAELWRTTFAAVLVSAIPLVGAWAASKWMIPWADKVAGSSAAGYKAATQGWWALGATLGSFIGAQAAVWLGRRRAYALISVGATVLTIAMFQGTRPMTPSFHPIVFAQGLVATLYFGWLAVYLPELFSHPSAGDGDGARLQRGPFRDRRRGARRRLAVRLAGGGTIPVWGRSVHWCTPPGCSRSGWPRSRRSQQKRRDRELLEGSRGGPPEMAPVSSQPSRPYRDELHLSQIGHVQRGQDFPQTAARKASRSSKPVDHGNHRQARSAVG